MNMMRRDLPKGTFVAAPARATPGATVRGTPVIAANSYVAPHGASAPAPTRPGIAGARPAPNPAPQPGRPLPGISGVRPSAKADDLFQVIRQLTDLLVKENGALKKHRTDDVKALTEKKEQLARLYQSHMNAVHRDPTLLKSLEQSKRDMMAQAAMRLGDLMQENASLLKANIQSINMFFKAVTDAVKTRQEEKAAAYSRNGALNGYAVSKRNLAVSFNQTM
jgi:hypothetical protein